MKKRRKRRTGIQFVIFSLVAAVSILTVILVMGKLTRKKVNIDNSVEINEDDHVELNNGKSGIVADITNNVYTIEVDEKFKTGNIDDDIMIVAANSIIGRK